MRAAESRFRLVVLLCGIAAAALAVWRTGSRAGQSRAGGRDARDERRARTGAAAPSSASPSTKTEPRATRSDSEFAQEIAGSGMLLAQRDDSIASFYFVTLSDSSTSLPALGFLRAATLLDSAAELEAYGDVARLPHLRVASPRALDSALHARDDGCVVGIPVPLQPELPRHSSSVVILTPGAAEAVTSSVWRASTNSVADRAEALRLAEAVPLDTNDVAVGVPRPSILFADVPLRLVAHYRFAVDGVEIMFVEARREIKRPPAAGRNYELEIEEQRLLIAERDMSDKSSPFRVTWYHYNADNPDQLVTEAPEAMLQLGPARVLTLLTDGHYREGAGGLFIARVGRGQWRQVASWYTGC
jgi:hypothetical protein